MAYLELRDIRKSYKIDNEVFQVLRGISLNFNRGEFVSILGESGGGKTTLMNIIAGLDSDYKGDVIVNGKSLKADDQKQLDEYRRSTIGFIFQNFNLINHLTVLQNVMVSLEMTTLNKKQQKARAIEMLKKVGLYDHRNQHSSQLSGGQKQRVSIARALAPDPDIIIADEPTGALDAENTKEILKLMNEIAMDGKLVLAVTHSQVVADYGTRIVHLADGKIDEDKILKPAYPVKEHKVNFKARPARFSSIFAMAFDHFKYNLKRNLLIMFGAAIGIFSVIFMLGLGNGVQRYINHEIYSQINPSTAVVKRYQKPGQISMTEKASKLTNQDLNQIKKVKHVKSVTPASYLLGGKLLMGNKVASVQSVITTWPEQFLHKDIKAGHQPKNGQIMISKDAASTLDAKHPYQVVGKTVTILSSAYGKNGFPKTIKGQLTVSGVQTSSNPMLSSVMPYDTMKQLFTQNGLKMFPSASSIQISGGVKNVNPVQDKINGLDKKGKTARFVVTGPGAIVSTLNTYVNLAFYILAAVAAISLLVSAIMIVVVLYISVAERTKEIGIMRALGFSKTNISNLFFSEAFFLGLFSSIGAVILSYVVELGADFLSKRGVGFAIVQIEPMNAIWVSLIFIIICLLAALAPAAKAAKLDPVVCLTSE